MKLKQFVVSVDDGDAQYVVDRCISPTKLFRKALKRHRQESGVEVPDKKMERAP